MDTLPIDKSSLFKYAHEITKNYIKRHSRGLLRYRVVFGNILHMLYVRFSSKLRKDSFDCRFSNVSDEIVILATFINNNSVDINCGVLSYVKRFLSEKKLTTYVKKGIEFNCQNDNTITLRPTSKAVSITALEKFTALKYALAYFNYNLVW